MHRHVIGFHGMLRRFALNHVQVLHRKGNFYQSTRFLSTKWTALMGCACGIIMGVYARGLPISQRSIWLGLIMWVTIGILMFLLWGYIMRSHIRLGLSEMDALRNNGYCPFCGYDQRGATSGLCSECGKHKDDFKSTIPTGK